MGQEVVSGLGPPLLEGEFGDLGVGKFGREVVQAPQPRHVGDGLDVEDEYRRGIADSGRKTPVDR